MTRRFTKRGAAARPTQASEPVKEQTTLERTIAALNDPAPQPEPFAGKGDHDDNGKVGGAHAPVAAPVVDEPLPVAEDPLKQAAVKFLVKDVPAVAAPPKIPSEPTLNDLNRQSWAIDDQHAAKRREAEEAISKVADEKLAGVQRGRARVRRIQKPLRPPVRL